MGLPVADLVRLAERGVKNPSIQVPTRRQRGPMENAEFAALVLLVQDWNSIAPWLVESLFDDDANRMAFLALAESGGDFPAALDLVAPDAREVLERAAVADLTLAPDVEARTLIGAAVRRELRLRSALTDREAIDDDRRARLDVEAMAEPDRERAQAAAESLLGWLNRRSEERRGGAS